MSERDYMTAAEVAEVLRVHRRTVLRLATDETPTPRGSIPGFRVGRVWRFHRDQIERLASAAKPIANGGGPVSTERGTQAPTT